MKPIFLKSFLNFMGAVNLGNGLWMLFFAKSWFDTLPAIHDTGPLNKHFVHDIGMVYSLCGLGLMYCAYNLTRSINVYLCVMLFFVGHAAIHVVEIIVGLLPPSHWVIDFPLIFVPAIVLAALTPTIKRASLNL